MGDGVLSWVLVSKARTQTSHGFLQCIQTNQGSTTHFLVALFRRCVMLTGSQAHRLTGTARNPSVCSCRNTVPVTCWEVP
jgi:hypothetical protein